ncbi:MAG: hypothetical protein STSR0002_17150 [Smithella sp.]
MAILFLSFTVEITRAAESERVNHSPIPGVGFIELCTPGRGVNLWGVSPLYVNPVNVKSSWTLTKVLAEGKGGIARDRPKEA